MMYNLQGKITYANRAAYEVAGFDYEKQELTGASMGN